MNTIEVMRPKPCPVPLIRVGGDKDGGYLLPDDLSGIKACFSPGVNNFKNFEDELLEKYRIVSHMCDFSSDVEKFKTPLQPGQTFKKKWLDVNDDKNSISLSEWIVELEPDSNDDLLLQMDIEGAEYRNILNTPESILQRFRIIIIELHGLSVVNQPEKFKKELGPLLTLLGKHFTCVHAHPNNCCGEVTLSGSELNIPKVHELTFLRKDRWNGVEQSQCHTPLLPHPLDISQNVASKPPLFLNEHWLDSGTRTPESVIKMLNDQVSYLTRALKQSESEKKLQFHSDVLLELHRLAQHAAATMPSSIVTPNDVIDLAKDKTFSISSVHAQCPKGRTITEICPFFFHTNQGRNECITIDLGNEHQLFELHILNRSDHCKKRACCLFYCVHNDPKPNFSLGLPIFINDDFLKHNGIVSITNLGECRARYLTIFSPEDTFLHLSAVRILGL